jgi:hypothetical protein
MRSDKNTTKYTNYLLTFIFAVTTSVHLVKFENNLYIPEDYAHYSNRTEIELVVSERSNYNLSLNKLNTAPKQVTDFTFAHIDFSSIHKYWLIQYQNYIVVLLKSFSRTFIPNKQFVSILKNMWHHSSYFLGN